MPDDNPYDEEVEQPVAVADEAPETETQEEDKGESKDDKEEDSGKTTLVPKWPGVQVGDAFNGKVVKVYEDDVEVELSPKASKTEAVETADEAYD